MKEPSAGKSFGSTFQPAEAGVFRSLCPPLSPFLMAGNNNTHAGIVLGGGYLITDIQMSTAGRPVPSEFHSRLVAAAI